MNTSTTKVELDLPMFPGMVQKSQRPRGFALAIASVDNLGTPGPINKFVRDELGFSTYSWPVEKDLSKGFQLVVHELNNSMILYIVTVESTEKGYITDAARVRSNLSKAISSNLDLFNRNEVWIPALGVGRNGLTYEQSYSLMTEVFQQFADRLQTDNIVFSLPMIEPAVRLFDLLKRQFPEIDRARRKMLKASLLEAKNFWWMDLGQHSMSQGYELDAEHAVGDVVELSYNVPNHVNIPKKTAVQDTVLMISARMPGQLEAIGKVEKLEKHAATIKVVEILEPSVSTGQLLEVFQRYGNEIPKGGRGIHPISRNFFLDLMVFGGYRVNAEAYEEKDKIPFHLDQVETTDYLNRDPTQNL